jgi:hypothetical protein
MTGGLMQLVAYGAQDIYLTGNPMITYFKVVYRRHTNFAMESIEQTFNGTVGWGNKVSCLISRNGDLVSGLTLEADLPTAALANVTTGTLMRWQDDLGHHIINEVNVEIGGQQIDKHYGDWLEIWAQLSVPASKMSGYRKMIGQDPVDGNGQAIEVSAAVGLQAAKNNNETMPNRRVYVPLQFWFCRNIGLALPLIALQYHEVKINITFATLARAVYGDNAADSVDGNTTLSASLWADYIYLDTDERRRFAQVSHEYLIEQLQFSGDLATTASTENTFKLNFNHPVKELVWVTRTTANNTDTTGQLSNFTNAAVTVRLSEALTSSSTPGGIGNANPSADDVSGALAGDGDFVSDVTVDTSSNLAGDLATFGSSILAVARRASERFTATQSLNPTVSAYLKLNGHDRFASRQGLYFNLVQTCNHHTSTPESPGINVYSFALKPEDHQPSGTCNFSRIDNADLKVTTATTSGGITKIFAVNYNVLRIMSGMGGLAYSN